MFMVLVDYGEHSLPSLVADRPTVKNNKSGIAEKNEQASNDISVFYPSKCFYQTVSHKVNFVYAVRAPNVQV